MIEGLVGHVERHLGPIAGEWDADPDGIPLPFGIVHYVSSRGGRAPAGTEVFSTLGLSDFPLGEHGARIELLMIAPDRLTPGAIPPVLHHAGALPIAAGGLPRYGDTYCAVEGLREVSPMDNLLVSRPLYQKPDFSPFDNAVERVHFLWLIPIYDIEAEFVEHEGWPAFEHLMWELDVDPTDFVRQPWLE